MRPHGFGGGAREHCRTHHGRFRRHRDHFYGGRGRRLQSKLFWWFGATILLTGATVFTMHAVFGSAAPDLDRGREFVAERFRESWDNPAERRQYAKAMHEVFHLNVALVDAAGRPLERFGDACPPLKSWKIPIRHGDELAGSVIGCWPASARGPMLLVTVLAACAVLWAASSVIARRITRPLRDLVRVTREIGAGKLSSRVGLGRHHAGEIGVLADAVNDMAVRIERQMRDQRELLAAVSHEIRSPLARLRVLVELAQNGRVPDTIAKVEREVLEIDALVGKLLANSRVDFDALSPQRLSARDVAMRELERAGLDAELLRDESDGARIEVDATLLGRALANLIENAVRHAGGVEALVVARRDGNCVFSVDDAGPGFSKEMLARAFDAFYRGGDAGPSASEQSGTEGGAERSSLGLGLALVERIARAHGGRAWLENRPGRGASAKLAVPLAHEVTRE